MLRNVSQKKLKFGKNSPELREGSEGSRTTRKLQKGLFDFIKIGNKWFSSRYNEKPLSIKEEINLGVPNINFRDHKTDIYGDVIIKGKAPELSIVGDGTEDAGIQFSQTTTGTNWQIGVDYSDTTGTGSTNVFKLSKSYVFDQIDSSSVDSMIWDNNGNVHLLDAGGTASALRFYDDDNSHYAGLKAHATTTASVDYAFPASAPDANKILQSTSAGALSWIAFDEGTSAVAATVTIADESSDTTCFPLFSTHATGDREPKTGDNLLFNSATGLLTATGFSGPLTGNVTGNASGTAATVTAGTQAAITTCANLTTVGTIATGEWNATVIPSAKLDADTAHLSGTQSFTGAKTFNTTTPSVTIQGDTITTAKDFSQLIIASAVNESDSDAAHFHANLELSIVNTDVGGYSEDGLNYILCHNESTVGAGGVSRTPHFRVNVAGSIFSTGSLSLTGTASCSEIIAGAVLWQEWIFNTFRGVANRYYYRDIDDADDFRRWDAYSTLSGSDISIATQMVAGHFNIPENCTIKEMHGQVMNNGSTSCPTITIWHGNPSDATDVTLTTLGGAQPNSGSALTSQKSYIFSKTDYDTDLSAGDIIVPTVHYGSGSLQSFIGSLTVKFVTR